MPSTSQRVVLATCLILLDLIALNAAYLTALYLRFHAYEFELWARRFVLPYFYLLIATNGLYVLLLFYYREFSFPRRFKPTHVLPRIARIILITVLVSVMIIFLSKGLSQTRQVFHFSRPTLLAFWVLSFLYISAGRFLFGVGQYILFHRGKLLRPAILVGEGSQREDLENRLRFNRWFGIRIAATAVVRKEEEAAVEEGTRVLPDSEAFVAYLRETGIREVFLAIPPHDLAQVFRVTRACRQVGATLRMTPHQLQLVISHLLLSESLPVADRTKEDLVTELYRHVDSRFSFDLATVAMIGAKGIPATFGGIEHHVAELTNRLARRGFHVMVYCRPYYTTTEGRFQGVELIKLPTIYTKHLDAITHTLLATIHVIFQRVDVAHYHAQGPSVLSIAPRLLGIRTVTTVHGLDWKRQKWGSFAKRCLRIGEFTSAVFPTRTIAVSRTLKSYYESKYGRRVHYIPNGISVKETPAAAEIRERFGLEPRRYVLFVGRLVPEKGCHYLIEAFRSVKTDMKLVFAGGSSHSDEYTAGLKEAAERDERVRFLGYVYGEALDELYAHSYVYVHPSDLEGLSIALLEALSFGSCVLASDIRENLEVLRDEDTPEDAWNRFPPGPGAPVGYRFRNGDSKSLAEMIEKLLANPESADRMRAKSRQWIRERYDWESVGERTASVFLDIIRK